MLGLIHMGHGQASAASGGLKLSLIMAKLFWIYISIALVTVDFRSTRLGN